MDNRWRETVVVAEAEVRAKDLILLGDRAQVRQTIELRERRVDRQRTPEPDRRRDGGVDQTVERVVSEHLEHGAYIGVRRADVARNEARRLSG